jgi:hypothetical protein
MQILADSVDDRLLKENRSRKDRFPGWKPLVEDGSTAEVRVFFLPGWKEGGRRFEKTLSV